MSGRTLCAFVPMALLLGIGVLGVAPRADAAATNQALSQHGASTQSNVIEIKQRWRGRPLYVPMVPYLAYDYPYYYRRGFYPEHIGPGYIHYGHPYFYRKKYSRRCSYRYWRCAAAHKRRVCRCR